MQCVFSTKLRWWRQEVERVFETSPEHPVGKELAQALSSFSLAREHFEDIIDGMEMDLDHNRYASFKDLSLYCHRVAGVVGLMAAEIFGYDNRHTQKYAHNLGMAFQLTNILRDVREDAGRGRVYLPQDELERFGVNAGILNSPRDTDRTRALFAYQAARARQYYERALSLLPDEDRYRQRSGLIMAAIYQTTLAEIEKDGYRILEHRIVLTPLRKLWIAWTTALREHRRHAARHRSACSAGATGSVSISATSDLNLALCVTITNLPQSL